jgi:predicted transcriptional regulator of viral defense system
VRPADALGDLLQLGRPVVETREAATRLSVSVSRASQLLRSLEVAGLVGHLRHGLWLLEHDVDPFSIAPYLTAPFPAYVSYWSALARHGMIEQVPGSIFVASLDRAHRVRTSLAMYSIHHLAPELFDGYSGSGSAGYLANPEKALFDTIYLQAARGGGVFLPELELPESFDSEKLALWTARIAGPRLRTLVSREIERRLVAVQEAE